VLATISQKLHRPLPTTALVSFKTLYLNLIDSQPTYL